MGHTQFNGLEADGHVTVYDIESGTAMATYEGLEVHAAMVAYDQLGEAPQPPTNHQITLMVQRSMLAKQEELDALVLQVAGLVNERDALREQVAGLASERAALRVQLTEARRLGDQQCAEIDRLRGWLSTIAGCNAVRMAESALHTTLHAPAIANAD